MKAELKITFMRLMFLVAFMTALYFIAGCSVTKINYEKDDKGAISYRIYRNDHWLKTDASGIKGGMSDDGKFEFSAEGLKSSPSEEFNRTMQTYTTAFVQLAQIAAAAYNPSASKVVSGGVESGGVNTPTPSLTQSPTSSSGEAAAKASASTSSAATQSSDPHAADCTDGNCSDGSCTDGSCTPEAK